MIIREGSTRELWCIGDMVLDIYFAKYEGRAIYCGRNEVTASVQQQCDGLARCQVSAKDEIYDDSCAFSNEVLTIRYGCVGEFKRVYTDKSFFTHISVRCYDLF